MLWSSDLMCAINVLRSFISCISCNICNKNVLCLAVIKFGKCLINIFKIAGY
jgi:hypothetical protein